MSGTKAALTLLGVLLYGSVTPAGAAVLNNTDSQEHVVRIQEYGEPAVRQYYKGTYNSEYGEYRVLEHSRIEVCLYGCVITMLTTGQAVALDPDDIAVIDGGALTVHPGTAQQGGW